MGEKTVGNPAKKTKEYRWLITYNDTLPFYYVSQKRIFNDLKKKTGKRYTGQFR